jgi:hypothetical protein
MGSSPDAGSSAAESCWEGGSATGIELPSESALAGLVVAASVTEWMGNGLDELADVIVDRSRPDKSAAMTPDVIVEPREAEEERD